MNLTREDLENKVDGLREIVSRINIYRYNLEGFINQSIVDKMPEKHFKAIYFDLCRSLAIDIAQLTKNSSNDCLNFYKFKSTLSGHPFRHTLDLSKLEQLKPSFNKIITFRDNKYAHHNINDIENFNLKDIHPLIEVINSIFEEICKYLEIEIDESNYKTLKESYNIHQYFYNALHSGDLKIYYRD